MADVVQANAKKASVATEHKDYFKFAPKWKRARDVLAGQDAIHAAGALYLPKLTGQDDLSYKAYKNRAGFFNASWRTVSGLNGMLFRKEPNVNCPDGLKEPLEDVSLSDTPVEMFAQNTSLEVLSIGRVGVLVDYPSATENMELLTVAKVREMNLRPTMAIYTAESIINWKYAYFKNRYQLSMVVLKEENEVFDPDNQFASECKTQYRVLDIFEGIYRIRLFEVQSGEDVQIGKDIFPLMNGKKLDFIPFVTIGPDGLQKTLEEPPLIDLFDVNLSHYRTNADYEHGCHFTGLPTPVICGYEPSPNQDGTPPPSLSIGSETAWVLPNAEAHAEYLEFTGAGLSALENNLDRKERQMAVLGARMLADEKKQVEAYGAQQLKRTGENSILSNIAISVSFCLSISLRWFADWAGIESKDVSLEINRDFLPVAMDAKTLTAIMAAWQQGGLSEAEMFDLFKRGDLIEGDKR